MFARMPVTTFVDLARARSPSSINALTRLANSAKLAAGLVLDLELEAAASSRGRGSAAD